MLKFIGTGSAFNTKLGNNGAYIKEDDELFLIDCGSSTFSKLIEYGLLNGIRRINVLITHTHPDHIGSLGDLIFYAYYSLQPLFVPKVTIYYPYNYPGQMRVISHLETVGIPRNLFVANEIIGDEYIYIGGYEMRIEPVKVEHVKELPCYGYIIKTKGKTIYYSGDSNMIPEGVLKLLYDDTFNYFYQDTCKADYEGNVHLSLNKLTKLIEEDFRDLVYCMHLDNGFDIDEAKELGFNVVSAEIN